MRLPTETVAAETHAPLQEGAFLDKGQGEELAETVIEHRPGWQLVDVRELWHYRELLFFLTWRDIKVRYKQTALGAAWAILQPLATMMVFSIFFALANPPSGGVPYPLFVLAGLLPWFFFANAISSASQSIIGDQSLVTKVYFPRLLIPMGAVAATCVDFLIGLGMLLAIVPFFGILPGWGLLLVPLLAFGLVIAGLAIGTLLSALTVAYRDFRYVVPFLVQLWMFATPTIYMEAHEKVDPRWLSILPLNPAYGLITNFRAAIVNGPFDLYALSVSGAVSLVLLLFGCLYFRQVERSFADII